MPSLRCPDCGAVNSEFESQCASCGASLPAPPQTTLFEGINSHGPPGGGGGNGKAPPAGGEDQDSEDADELRPGQEISHFRILGRLGRGGMGTVYRALDLELGREVALKFLRPERQRRRQDLARFQREAEALAKLDHPNIGTLYHVDQWQGRRFLAMALYDGETLAEHLARQPEQRLPVAQAITIAGQLASALQAAQGAGLVHRDLKPENVIILPDGWVKLIDFGLARWAGSPRQTEQGMAVGTIRYMAPEQIRSEEAIAQTDLWALGVVLYEMLAGRHPFRGKGLEIGQAILYEKPFPLRQACPQVPLILEKLVARCLAKETRDRWTSAAGILAELQMAGLSGSGVAIPVPPPASRTAWRSWKIVAPAALLLLGVAIAGYFLIHHSRPVYVAVLQPEIVGSLPPGDQVRVRVNLRAALLRTVALLDGLVAQDPKQIDDVRGSPSFIARVLGTDELVTSLAYCDGDNCRVTLKRLDGQTARKVWATTEEELHPTKPKLFATMVIDLLRKGYPHRKPRVPQLDLKVGDEEYRRYIELFQRNESMTEEPNDLAALFIQIKALSQRAPDFADVYLLAANVSRRLHDSTKNTDYLDQGTLFAEWAHKTAPGDPRPLKILSDLYSAGLYPQAGRVLDQLAKVDLAGSQFRRSLLYKRQGRLREALNLMAEATRRHPSVNAFLFLANFEYQQGLLQDARGHYEDLLQLQPGNIEGLKGLNQIELLVDPQQAVKRLREATKRDRGPDSLINLGTSLLGLRRYGEAERYLRQALAVKADDPSAALDLGDCLLLLNRSQEANEYYSQVVAVTEKTTSPSDWQRLSVRAQAFAHLGQAKEAENTIQTALSVAPASQQLACEAAGVYVTLGRPNLAIYHARRAAAGGAGAYCLGFPLFDPLRQNPDFQKLLNARPPTTQL